MAIVIASSIISDIRNLTYHPGIFVSLFIQPTHLDYHYYESSVDTIFGDDPKNFRTSTFTVGSLSTLA
jgi:hypothetical protein